MFMVCLVNLKTGCSLLHLYNFRERVAVYVLFNVFLTMLHVKNVEMFVKQVRIAV